MADPQPVEYFWLGIPFHAFSPRRTRFDHSGVTELRRRGHQETQKFKSGTQTVPLCVTVTDATRRLVPELAQEDFEILDNGKPQSITLFDNEIRPIAAVVMLDTSGSMTLALDLVKKASEQFVIRPCPTTAGVLEPSTTRSNSSRQTVLPGTGTN